MAIFTETFGFICSIHSSSNLKIEIEYVSRSKERGNDRIGVYKKKTFYDHNHIHGLEFIAKAISCCLSYRSMIVSSNLYSSIKLCTQCASKTAYDRKRLTSILFLFPFPFCIRILSLNTFSMFPCSGYLR